MKPSRSSRNSLRNRGNSDKNRCSKTQERGWALFIPEAILKQCRIKIHIFINYLNESIITTQCHVFSMAVVEWKHALLQDTSHLKANSHRTDANKHRQTRSVLADQCVTPVGVCWHLSELVFGDWKCSIRFRMSEKWRVVIWWLLPLVCICWCSVNWPVNV